MIVAAEVKMVEFGEGLKEAAEVFEFGGDLGRFEGFRRCIARSLNVLEGFKVSKVTGIGHTDDHACEDIA